MVSLATLAGWWAARGRDDASIHRWSEIQARAAAAAIEERRQLFELAFLRMARRMELRPDPVAWRSDAARYRQGFPALEAILWYSGDHALRAAEPSDLAGDCAPGPAAAAFREQLAAAGASGGLYWAAGPRREEVAVLCAYAPLGAGGGYLAAQLAPRETLQRFLPAADERLRYEADLGGEPLFSTGGDPPASFTRFASLQSLDLGGLKVDIRAGPTRLGERALRPATATLGLVGGQLVAVLLGLALWSAGRARRRSIALAALNQRLAQEIGQRRRAEQQREREAERLRVAAEQLGRSNQELKDFASVLSHDLRAPLRGISSLAQWLAEDHGSQLDEEGRGFVDLIRQRVVRLDGLIAGVLQISRVSRDAAAVEPVSLKALVEEVVGLLDLGDRAEVTLEGELPELRCRPAHIALVLQNLIANAVRYCDKPRARVRVSCDRQGEAWRVGVHDNGPGIDPSHHALVFRMFQRLDPKGEEPGTGVGLALSRKIVVDHGGQIGVESAPGEGATFWFTLPVAGPPDEEAADRPGA